MKQVTLNIPDDKFNSFMLAIKKLPFVKVTDKNGMKLSGAKKKIADDLKEAMREVRLHEEGKIKLKTFDQLLDEL